MRNIIKVLLNEGIEREDVVAICKYIKENYEVSEAIGYDLDAEILAQREKDKEEQEKNMKAIELANKEREEFEAMRKRAAEKLNK